MNTDAFGTFAGIGILVFLCYLGGALSTYINHMSQLKTCIKIEEVKK
jgi:hypothetical protein